MVFSVLKRSVGQSVVAENEVPTSSDRSVVRDFLMSIATVTGDLSNITAPPSVLAPKSTVEVPVYQAESPSLFVSGALSDDPAERAMLVLRSFLGGIRSQCYMGHDMEAGLKKPLNAFLGELFSAKWEDENGTTTFVSEQVSHHPPIAACKAWNDKYGVALEAHNRLSITFSGSLNVTSTGHAVKTFLKHDEHYLLPIPDFKIKGLLSSAPYPELTGTYYIPSTSGYMSVVHFSEKGWFGSGGAKHSFQAHVYKQADGEAHPLYTLKGQWSDSFTVHDNVKDKTIETFSFQRQIIDTAPPMQVDPIEQQDAWQSRRAWSDVISAIQKGDMRSTSQAKSRLEQGQRQMRRDEIANDKKWEPFLFKPVSQNETVNGLVAMLPGNDSRKQHKIEAADMGWMLDVGRFNQSVRPSSHYPLRPDNTKVGNGV